MIIDEIKLFQYKLPFQNELLVRQRCLRSRRGIILQITDKSGARGYGEIAPLVGMSSETLQDVRDQLPEVLGKIIKKTIPPQPEQLYGEFGSWVEGLDLLPSVRFGLETAVLTPSCSFQKHIHG